jgi:uncharacterized membrane protein
MEEETARENMPFVAPCRHVPASAPWYWLLEGFEDLRKAPLHSMGYGLVMAGMIMAATVAAWQYGSLWIMFAMLCGFVFIATGTGAARLDASYFPRHV